jgi:hypothetical protein
MGNKEKGIKVRAVLPDTVSKTSLLELGGGADSLYDGILANASGHRCNVIRELLARR